MEFKRKLHQRQAAHTAAKKHDAGMVRVKVRGRKRWIKPTRKNREAESH